MVTTSRCIEHFLWLKLYQNQGLYTTRQTNRRNFSQDRAINDTTVDNGRLIHILNHFLDHRVSDPVFLVIIFEIRSRYVALAYMTGILPIKKYGSHSALNMFTEYSMTDPGELAEYFGFTESEVSALCEKYQINFEEAKAWYDGYDLIAHRRSGDEHYSMYSPKSVVDAMLRHKFGTYWNQTETYEALKIYIQMDMDGLQDAVVRMLAGEAIKINPGTFSNDMTTFASKDDVLTLLVHLGYLTYNSIDESVTIPNKEVSQEYVNALSTMNWHGVTASDIQKIANA